MLRILLSLLLAAPGAYAAKGSTNGTKSGRKAKAKASAHAAAHEEESDKVPFLSTSPITVVFPTEGMTTPMGLGEMVYGAVKFPTADFRINGNSVKPHRLGGYLTYLPIRPGTFTFHCELTLPGGTTAAHDRTIFVAPPSLPLPGPAVINENALFPAEDAELQPGDWISVQMKATPGLQAEFQIKSQKKRWPMTETDSYLGIYHGVYQTQPDDSWDPSTVQFYAKSASGYRAKAESKGRIAVRPSLLPVAVVTGTNAYVKTGPADGYFMFPPQGTRLLTAGHQGAETKVWFSPTLTGWIPTASISPTSAGTPPPAAVLGTIRTSAGSDSTFLTVGAGQTVPFSVDVDPDLSRLTLRLYYATDHTSWIIYESSDTFIQNVSWKQEETDVVAVNVRLSPHRRLWGYHAKWENGSLKLELRHPPRLSASGSALKGRIVIVDAGHMPSLPGAVGPRGVLEKDVNLAIAKELEIQLREAGAKPLMTRAGDDEVGLLERTHFAWDNRGDVFISVHNNNMPDATNPFKTEHGYSTFYYQPMGFDLARAIHRAYRRAIPLPDEYLRYGNILVARLTEMPAVLTESAYIDHPEQEALLTTPSFRRKLAAAMLDGLRDFLEAERARQRQYEEPAPAGAGKGRH